MECAGDVLERGVQYDVGMEARTMNAIYTELPKMLKAQGNLPTIYQAKGRGQVEGLIFPPDAKMRKWGLSDCVGIEVRMQDGKLEAFWGF